MHAPSDAKMRPSIRDVVRNPCRASAYVQAASVHGEQRND
jgi:hypothetical protein